MHFLYTILQKNFAELKYDISFSFWIYLYPRSRFYREIFRNIQLKKIEVNIFIKISLSFVKFSCSIYRFVDDIS